MGDYLGFFVPDSSQKGAWGAQNVCFARRSVRKVMATDHEEQ